MIIRFTRIRTAVVALCATAAIASVAAGTAAAATGHPAHPAGHRSQDVAAASLPVVINCVGKHQVKPGSYVLACADGGAFITKMHWASWGGQAAFGSGTDSFNTCVPSCVAGKLVSFPILAALWRVEPLPGHRGVHYFTRLTLIYTGNRSYKAGGKKFHLPQTVTDPLSNFGGAG
jgi:hypothetical protein